MDINRTYEALTSPTPPQHLKRAGTPFATASALALLVQIECAPLLALSYSAEDLQARFPHDQVPLRARGVFKQELTRYLAWRRTLFDLFLLETGSFADRDVVAGFERIARLQFGRHANALYILRHALPPELEIRELTSATALQIDRRLPGKTRPPYRAALALLDRLQGAPLAAGSRHLLPSEIIGRLPAPSGHLYHAPLPPRLAATYSNAPPLVRAAMPFVYRLSLMTGILSQDQDPSLDELASKSMSLWGVDPNDHGFRRPSQVALKAYIRNIGNHVQVSFSAPKQKQSALLEAWSDLREQMRAHGKEASIQRTFGLSRYAIRDEVSPAQITPTWVRKTVQSLHGYHRNAFRSGIFILDDLIIDESFPRRNLPREISGLVRERRQPKA
ncbi:hypothetical protein GI582_05335 [Sulfitobacter sp. BDSS02]|uniref:hypothetical protein n=1 Tax=Heliomarina sp. TaxID=2917556 RepID=UPI004058EBC7|nr:hypothetical protein [Sulfitobacter sp. BDSS02]MBR9848469.1 hypothetical protein [Paracoccaceae bacterium]